MGPIPKRIDGVALGVSDVEASADFYRDVMAFTELSRTTEIARFALENVRLTLVRTDVLLDETHLTSFPKPPGPVTLAVYVPRDEVDTYMQALADAGVRIIAPAEDKPLGPRIGFAADPDGHIWEIIEDY
jgi:catechol 2,3-dioxygenase-like lactoylglutathione lyase family enzyme